MKSVMDNSVQVVSALVLFGTALLFGLSGIGKLASMSQFESVMHGHEVLPAESVSVIAAMIPIAEIVLALVLVYALVNPRMKPWAGLGALSLVSAFTLYLGVVWSVQPDAASCGCGGEVIDLSVRAGLYRNGVLLSLLFLPVAVFRTGALGSMRTTSALDSPPC